jgi:hypothetical protein
MVSTLIAVWLVAFGLICNWYSVLTGLKFIGWSALLVVAFYAWVAFHIR